MGWRDSFGKAVQLGRELGRGGEGTVYEVAGQSDRVAKVYHEALSGDRRAKLQAMVQGCDDNLNRIVAWPSSLLYPDGGGQPKGFIMPKIASSTPLHHLYGPRHRKQQFPKADWAFLVNAARNVAAAFYVIHSKGHVVGDVNPKLVFVAESGVVRLIDCDSFQIANGTQTFLCEVGVPHFTPPEMQSLRSFRGFQRTTNHDNFGLALLVFHLLLMGRHPFSGVYSGKDDMPLEKAIAEFRYAFGQRAAVKGMRPPPNSITPGILPPPITALFERAFSEEGTRLASRPTAAEWATNLDRLKGQLRACGQERMHTFFAGLSSCPWCAQEQRTSVYYFLAKATATLAQAGFDLAKVWARIEAVAPPGPAPQPAMGGPPVQPMTLPPELQSAKSMAVAKKVIGGLLILGSLIFAPMLIIFALLVSGFLLFSNANANIAPEKRRRESAVQNAENELSLAKSHWVNEAGDAAFVSKLQQLAQVKGQYTALDAQFTREKKTLYDDRRLGQLHAYLDAFFIDDYDIPGVGPTRKATLASFNVETAADVNYQAIYRIKGFGPGLTDALIRWRQQLASKFVFDPNTGVDPAEMNALVHRFQIKHRQLEGQLLAGVEELQQIRNQVMQCRRTIPAYLIDANRAVAQAKANLTIF